jgi:hypothetical protein
MEDVIDGTSHTIAISETVQGVPGNSDYDCLVGFCMSF